MIREPYLTRLTVSLIDGLERVDRRTVAHHAAFLARQQRPDGGFPGREGGSDLYYTGFALRGLAVAQALTPEICNPCGEFLRSSLLRPAGVVDFFSLLVACYLVPVGGGPDVLAAAPADWKDRVLTTLATFRTADGGYGKTPAANSGSTYTSFLVALCHELLDRPSPEPDRLEAFVRTRQRDDGGFVEIAPMRRSGTNPTAAGVGVLAVLDRIDDAIRTRAVEFLRHLPTELEGGYRANDRIPAADLLSTFTASWTLRELGAADRIDNDAVRDYALACDAPAGGFRGGLWDDTADVEYTFYGLGTLAVTAE
jgi:geranylgeranyl transferase type-2 subunit beta